MGQLLAIWHNACSKHVLASDFTSHSACYFTIPEEKIKISTPLSDWFSTINIATYWNHFNHLVDKFIGKESSNSNVTRNVNPLQGASLEEHSSILQTENDFVLQSK